MAENQVMEFVANDYAALYKYSHVCSTDYSCSYVGFYCFDSLELASIRCSLHIVLNDSFPFEIDYFAWRAVSYFLLLSALLCNLLLSLFLPLSCTCVRVRVLFEKQNNSKQDKYGFDY